MDAGDIAKVVPPVWAAAKVLGPTLGAVGEDIQKLYEKGTSAIFKKAQNKIADLNDGKTANLRVTRDVFFNGSFSDSEICAEYFAGALASSRSDDGKDDSAIYYLSIIQNLSSTQLHLHYIIYHSINQLYTKKGEPFNVNQDTEVKRRQLFMSAIELNYGLNIPTAKDLVALHHAGLISMYSTQEANLDETGNKIVYLQVAPTTLGVQLFALALNKLDEYNSFDSAALGQLEDVKTAGNIFTSLNDLIEYTKAQMPNTNA